jgi:hypothetical protein
VNTEEESDEEEKPKKKKKKKNSDDNMLDYLDTQVETIEPQFTNEELKWFKKKIPG